VFAQALADADPRVVRAAGQGVQNSQDAQALALLVPVLEHTDPEVRSSASWAVRDLSPTGQVPKVAEVFLRTSDPQVISACAHLLIAGKWQDQSAIPNLVGKLRTVNEYERYDLIRLLRHLSGNAMGPKDENEWYEDPEGWYNKWLDWASRR
jgi:HEAT repeat protein